MAGCEGGRMTSGSDDAQDELNGLLNGVVGFAEQTLQRYGELYPFGAALDLAGEQRLLGADPGEGDHPDSTSVLEALYAGAGANADELRAVAFVADVLLDGSDALRVELEHSEGACLVVHLPYRLEGDGDAREVLLGDLVAHEAGPRIWGQA
ncbi:hypothetical protein ASF35_06675 [Aeromicrobium sp. Leaf291]|nr:hypothetical protein ASF35_06675 [Aeromicrobium sp. Leaf291]